MADYIELTAEMLMRQQQCVEDCNRPEVLLFGGYSEIYHRKIGIVRDNPPDKPRPSFSEIFILLDVDFFHSDLSVFLNPLRNGLVINGKSVRTVFCLSFSQASRIAYGTDKQQSPTLGGYIVSDLRNVYSRSVSVVATLVVP